MHQPEGPGQQILATSLPASFKAILNYFSLEIGPLKVFLICWLSSTRGWIAVLLDLAQGVLRRSRGRGFNLQNMTGTKFFFPYFFLRHFGELRLTTKICSWTSSLAGTFHINIINMSIYAEFKCFWVGWIHRTVEQWQSSRIGLKPLCC